MRKERSFANQWFSVQHDCSVIGQVIREKSERHKWVTSSNSRTSHLPGQDEQIIWRAPYGGCAYILLSYVCGLAYPAPLASEIHLDEYFMFTQLPLRFGGTWFPCVPKALQRQWPELYEQRHSDFSRVTTINSIKAKLPGDASWCVAHDGGVLN